MVEMKKRQGPLEGKLLFITGQMNLTGTMLYPHFSLVPLNFLVTLLSAGTITGGADNKKLYTKARERLQESPCIIFYPILLRKGLSLI